MDMKNATILLMFLLCILGLIVGVYYTEVSDSQHDVDDYEEVIHEDSNGQITIDLVLKENSKSHLNRMFT